jgi:hypothetical protein
MKTKREVINQKDSAEKELVKIAKREPGSGAWRRQKGYVDALEWVLGET